MKLDEDSDSERSAIPRDHECEEKVYVKYYVIACLLTLRKHAQEGYSTWSVHLSVCLREIWYCRHMNYTNSFSNTRARNCMLRYCENHGI